MSKEFNCPSCTAPIVFGGGESIFQTCKTCHAPIVIPSEIFYPKDKQIESGNFATLTNDISVDPEKVTNELTPGDELPNKNEVIDPEAKIEKFEIYQEKIGMNSVEAKQAVDKIIVSGSKLIENAPYKPPVEVSALDRIKSELRSGDKIEAIKIYRETYGKSLKEAKKIVEAIERKEFGRSGK